MSQDGYLYIAEETSRHLVKIGISVDTDRREGQLKSKGTLMPWKVQIVKTIHTPHYKTIEKFFQKLYERNNVEGEWYD